MNAGTDDVKKTPATVAALLGVTALLAGLGACGGASGDSTHLDASGVGPAQNPGAQDGGAAVDAPAGGEEAGHGDGGSAPKCTRETDATPAPASLYDTLAKDLAGLTGAARTARVDAFIAAVTAGGGAPLEDPASGRVVFVARGVPPEGTWAVATSLVSFDPAQATPLAQIADTDLYVAEAVIPRGASFTYKLVSGATFLEDPLARTVVWDGIERAFPERGEMNAVGHAMDWPKNKGRVVALGRVHATKLANDRDVFMYLPARYEDGTCTKLPSVVFQDGREALAYGDYAGRADALYAARPDLAAVLVFAAAQRPIEVRNDEYSFGYGGSRAPDYVDFVATELWAKMNASARLCSKPGARGLTGASLGGLVAVFAAFEKPGTWGWVGAQSGAFYWKNDELIGRAWSEAPVPSRIYVDSGDDNKDSVDAFVAALASKGYDHLRVTQAGGAHEWPYFRTRFEAMMTHFRSGKTDCD